MIDVTLDKWRMVITMILLKYCAQWGTNIWTSLHEERTLDKGRIYKMILMVKYFAGVWSQLCGGSDINGHYMAKEQFLAWECYMNTALCSISGLRAMLTDTKIMRILVCSYRRVWACRWLPLRSKREANKPFGWCFSS